VEDVEEEVFETPIGEETLAEIAKGLGPGVRAGLRIASERFRVSTANPSLTVSLIMKSSLT
jgi:hypothetical protein